MASSTRREKEKAQPIQVYVRIKPLTKEEIEARELTVYHDHYDCKYKFDQVFGEKSTQLDVYSSIVQPLIPEMIAGYNCTVFAYGETGTGKTHTMAGGSVFSAANAWQDDVEAGIIPRAIHQLLEELHAVHQQYTVRVSYLELYNEELFDLLSPTVEGEGIRLLEDQNQKGSVIIDGLTKKIVYNVRQVYEILQKGQENRRTALINAQASHSHTVFSIMVDTCETTVEGEALVKTGKLNLVDLAGSENIIKSRDGKHRAREAGNIHQSLFALERVIKALVKGSINIPYSESKLTRIFQDSLGGRTKTSIIVTISLNASGVAETLSTLDYANRARNITNRPEVNQILSQNDWKAQYEEELERLQKDLQAARAGSGVYLAREHYDRIMDDSEMCKIELAEKIAAVRKLKQQLKRMEEKKKMQVAELSQMLFSFDEVITKVVKLMETIKEDNNIEACATVKEKCLDISLEFFDFLATTSDNDNAAELMKNVVLYKNFCYEEIGPFLDRFGRKDLAVEKNFCGPTTSIKTESNLAVEEHHELPCESLEFKDEVSSNPNIPETVVPRSILRPDILQFKPSIDVEKKQESDEENTPEPTID